MNVGKWMLKGGPLRVISRHWCASTECPLPVSIPENSTAVTAVTATDPDVGTTLAYSISGGSDAARFQMNASTGALSFKTAPNFELPADADQNNSYIVQVTASDGALSDSQTLTVNVTDVLEAPPHRIASAQIGRYGQFFQQGTKHNG